MAVKDGNCLKKKNMGKIVVIMVMGGRYMEKTKDVNQEQMKLVNTAKKKAWKTFDSKKWSIQIQGKMWNQREMGLSPDNADACPTNM